MKNIIELNDDNFQQNIAQQSGLALVDFWAPWCAPCRLVAPVIEQLAQEFAGQVRFGKLNVDESPTVAGTYEIRSIPTIALFKDGEPVDGVVGAAPKAMLADMIRRSLPKAS